MEAEWPSFGKELLTVGLPYVFFVISLCLLLVISHFKYVLGQEKVYLLPLSFPRKLMTENPQVDHRKYVIFFN